MDSVIKGFNIELGLNTVGVSKGFKELKRDMAVVNSEMNSNLSAFDKGEKSIERYTATLEGLNKKQEIQSKIVRKAKENVDSLTNSYIKETKALNDASKKVEDTKRAHDNLVKSGTATKKEISAAAKEVQKAEKEFNDLNKATSVSEKEMDNARIAYNKANRELNIINRSIDNTSGALNKMQEEQRQANSEWTKLINKMDEAGEKLKTVGGKMTSTGQNLTMGISAPLTGFAALSVKTAGEYEAAASQFKVVFEGMEGEATDSLNNISKTTGLLPNSLKGTYTQIAAFAKTTGADTKEAMDLTSRATLAAADSAAFYDKNISEVTENLQSFLKGNYENDAALGISATETTRNAKANELYGKSFNDLNEQQKQLTLLKMVEDGNKLSGALGQASRESDTLGTQTANLKTAFADFQNEVGKPLLPIAIRGLKELSKAAKSASNWFNGLSDDSKKMVLAVGGIAIAAGPTLMAIGAMATGAGALAQGFKFVAKPLGLFTKSGRESSKVISGLSKGFKGFKNILSGSSKIFGSVIKNVGSLLPKGFGLLSKSIRGVTGAFKLLRLAFATNPLGIVLLGVTALGFGLVTLYKKNEKFRNAVNTMGKQVKKIFGQVVDFAKNLGKGFAKGFGKAIEATKNFAKNVGNKFKDMKDDAVKHTKNLYKGVTGWFTDLGNGIKSRTGKAYNWAKDNFTNMSTKSISLSKGLAKGALNKFTDLRDGIKSTTGKAYNWTKDNFTKMSSKSIGLSRDLTKGVLGKFGDVRDGIKKTTKAAAGFAIDNFIGMYKGAKKWTEKIGTFLTGFKDDLSKKAKSLGKSVANGAISGLNGMISGINSISSKIMDKKLLKKIPKLSTGTSSIVQNSAISTPTLAVVGDKGPGNGPGGFSHEVIHRANGDLHLTPATDTLVKLNKGDKVYNGTQTYNMMKQGLIPRFNLGTTLKSGWNSAVGFGSSVKDSVVDAGKLVGSIAGDIWDYVKDPKKLVEMVIGKLGGAFNSIGGITGDLGKAAFNKMKNALVDKVTSWFDESGGGDALGGVLDPSMINYHFGKTAAYTAATGRPYHEGVDFPFVYQEVGTPMSGTLKRQSYMAGGYGNWVKVVSGAVELIFAHLKNFSKSPKDGSHVKAGDIVGLTGNTGFSTGPHLHFGRRVNGVDVDPEPWLKKLKKNGSLKGPKGSSTGHGSADGWREDVIKAAKQMKVDISSKEVNGILAQIQRESNGNQSVTQSMSVWDINTMMGNPAKGLLQYIPQTFREYAVKGHNNILSGYDQLLAFFNNSNWRSDLPYGNSGWGPTGNRKFANGGTVFKNENIEVAENDNAEMIIPLTKRTRAVQLIEQAMKVIGMKNGEVNVSVNNDNDYSEIISRMDAQIQLLTKLLNTALGIEAKDTNINYKDVGRANDKYQQEQSSMRNIKTGRVNYGI